MSTNDSTPENYRHMTWGTPANKYRPCDVMKLAAHNSLLKMVISSWEHGEFSSWEQAMTAAVVEMARSMEMAAEREKYPGMTITFPEKSPESAKEEATLKRQYNEWQEWVRAASSALSAPSYRVQELFSLGVDAAKCESKPAAIHLVNKLGVAHCGSADFAPDTAASNFADVTCEECKRLVL